MGEYCNLKLARLCTVRNQADELKICILHGKFRGNTEWTRIIERWCWAMLGSNGVQSSLHESNRVFYIEYFGIQRTVVPSSWATSIWLPKFATVIYSAWLLIFHMFWHLTLQSRKLAGLKSDFTEYFDETPEHLAYCNRKRKTLLK